MTSMTATEARKQLYTLLKTFDKEKMQSNNWDAYSACYNPETVMARFNEVFLRGL